MITSLQKAIRSARAKLATMLLSIQQDMEKSLQPAPIPVKPVQHRQHRRRAQGYRR
ncbi:hypothetical protein [Endozoicomonas montiporae]|nr:hypothetical protein [Endozoicomonas montiporae]